MPRYFTFHFVVMPIPRAGRFYLVLLNNGEPVGHHAL
jgi:hypothetical protein